MDDPHRKYGFLTDGKIRKTYKRRTILPLLLVKIHLTLLGFSYIMEIEKMLKQIVRTKEKYNGRIDGRRGKSGGISR